MYFEQYPTDVAIVQYHLDEFSAALEALEAHYESIGTEAMEKDASEKEKSLAEKASRTFMKLDTVMSSAMKELDVLSLSLIKKLDNLSGMKLDDTKFGNMVLRDCPSYDALVKRPGMYQAIIKSFGDLSKIIAEPVTSSNVYGPTLNGIIKTIEGAGFQVQKEQSHKSMAHRIHIVPSGAGAPQKKSTAKSLKYTTANALKLCTTMTNMKKPGFFKTSWTMLRLKALDVRMLMTSFLSRKQDSVSKKEALVARNARIGVIGTITASLYWIQHKRDLTACKRILDALAKSGSAGTEQLITTDAMTRVRIMQDINPSMILIEDSFMEVDDVIVDTTDATVEPGLEDELEEDDASISELIAKNLRVMSYAYPSEGIKAGVLNGIVQMNNFKNKAAGSKIARMYRSTRAQNSKLLQIVTNLGIKLKRTRSNIHQKLTPAKMESLVIKQLPSMECLKGRMLVYKHIAEAVVPKKNDILRASVHEPYDLGKNLNDGLALCRFGNVMTMTDPDSTYYPTDTLFDMSLYDTETRTLANAQYTVVSLEQIYKTLMEIVEELPGEGTPETSEDCCDGEDVIVDATSDVNYTDQVCALTAGKARRLRYSLMNHMHTHVLLGGLIHDLSALHRIYSTIAKSN